MRRMTTTLVDISMGEINALLTGIGLFESNMCVSMMMKLHKRIAADQINQ